MSDTPLVDVPSIVLDSVDLDILELTLSGAIGYAVRNAGAAVNGTLLLDSENVPLADVVDLTAHEGPDQGLRPLRPFSRCQGPHCDPDLRRGPGGTRMRAPGAKSMKALILDVVPNATDLKRIAELGGTRAEPLLMVMPVSRSAWAETVEPIDGPGLARAGVAAAEEVLRQYPDLAIVPLILPWPAAPQDAKFFDPSGLDLDAVIEGYGATSITRLSSLRTPAELELATGLIGLWEREIARHYSDASAEELIRCGRLQHNAGAVILFTGLPGSGKSTLARALVGDLEHHFRSRGVTLLDGDEVRRNLASELGFDRESRETNVRRIGYVASLIAQHGGIAVAAPIAPFEVSRHAVRDMVPDGATFMLVHVSTPLEVCEERDRKGMYARARAGQIDEFTGISSPYEVPNDADLVIDTSNMRINDSVQTIREAVLAKLAAAHN